jgi:hypothetical protein
LAIATGATGSGNGSIGYSVANNTTALPRTAAIRVNGCLVNSLIQVIQSGTDTTAPFDDVPSTHPYVDHIRLMKSRAITSGCTATSYCPDGTVTRGQMAVFIIRGFTGGDTFQFTPTPYFTDVPATHPYFSHIQKMRDLGITLGCSTTPAKYCPDDPVTRGQMSAFLIRSKFPGVFGNQAAPYFTDVGTAHAYFSFVQKMKEVGITTGCSATQYCPDDPNSRGQMAVFIVRAFLTPW